MFFWVLNKSSQMERRIGPQVTEMLDRTGHFPGSVAQTLTDLAFRCIRPQGTPRGGPADQRQKPKIQRDFKEVPYYLQYLRFITFYNIAFHNTHNIL